MSVKLYLLALLFVIVSCNNHQTKQIKFPVTKNIYAKPVKTKSIFYSKRPSLIISDNKYLIYLETAKEPLFNVFSIQGFKFIGAFGKKGRGPNEFGFIDAKSLQPLNNGFCINDLNKGFLFVDISNFAQTKQFKIKNFNLPVEMFTLNNAFYLKDSLICGSPYVNNDFMYVKYNLKTAEVEYFGEYPNFYSEHKKDYWQIYSNKTTVKPDGKLFASFFSNIKMFRIYNSKGKLMKEVIMKVQDLYKGKEFNLDVFVFYTKVKSTEKFIYTYCVNYNLKSKKSFNPVIEVWDWKGNPVAVLKLDKYLSSFTITPDDKSLYLTDKNVIDSIFIYNLNFLKNKK